MLYVVLNLVQCYILFNVTGKWEFGGDDVFDCRIGGSYTPDHADEDKKPAVNAFSKRQISETKKGIFLWYLLWHRICHGFWLINRNYSRWVNFLKRTPQPNPWLSTPSLDRDVIYVLSLSYLEVEASLANMKSIGGKMKVRSVTEEAPTWDQFSSYCTKVPKS